jgi:hypothetical protein
MLSNSDSRLVLVNTFVGAALILLTGGVGSAIAEVEFCHGRTAVDYAAPFSRMPAMKPPPAELPFGPKHLHVYRSSEGPIVSAGGSVTYRFRANRGADHNVHLGWTAKASLVRVNPHGQAIERPRRAIRHLANSATLYRVALGFRLSKRPALYRFSLAFFNQGGRRLGRYGEYIREMHRRFDATLRVEKSNYHPGEAARLRVLNLGTAPITHANNLTVEVFNGSGWVPSSVFPATRVSKKATALSPGEAGACARLPIPSETPDGRYRVVIKVLPLFSSTEVSEQVEFRVSRKVLK